MAETTAHANVGYPGERLNDVSCGSTGEHHGSDGNDGFQRQRRQLSRPV